MAKKHRVFGIATGSLKGKVASLSDPTPREPVLFLSYAHRSGGFVASIADQLASVENVIAEGIPVEEFDSLKDSLGVSKRVLAESIGISSRTISRRKDRLEPSESEKLLRVGQVYALALHTLKNEASVRKWMITPKKVFNDRTPLSLCKTEFGAAEVKQILGRVEDVVYS